MTNNVTNTSYKIIVVTVRVFFNINLNNFGPIKSNRFFLDIDWLLNLLVLRLNVTSIRFFLVAKDKFPYNSLERAFYNFNNTCFGCCPTQTVGWLFNNYSNSVTVNGMANIITSDEHIIFIVINM